MLHAATKGALFPIDPPGSRLIGAVGPDAELMEFLRDARLRTIRIRCLSYEESPQAACETHPMEEADVRDLIDTVRYKEFTPNKFQQLWDTVQQEVWIFGRR